ncbi:MAG: phosphopantothenoylcysteine decarboxylase [Candidatus Omnitrophota bacterium]
MNKDRTSPTRILITAGPTIEPLDPVRFISNHSTGLMGYEIAGKAKEKGYEVCLITGPTSLSFPEGVDIVKVDTACEMRDRVFEQIESCRCLIMAAAVCDFRPREKKKQKIKKREEMTLELVKNPDILEEIGEKDNLVKIGFALETGDEWLEKAKTKLQTKKLDLIIVNVKTAEMDPFGPGKKDFVLIDKNNNTRELKGVSKEQCAEIIVKEAEKLF